ncbi:MAG: hypothetical protein OXH76_02280 [Boseongicola sp.]|nr:hypothetical protein [Boseongicola sp.]
MEDQGVPALQMLLCQAPLDPGLALQQPFEHVERLVADDRPSASATYRLVDTVPGAINGMCSRSLQVWTRP